MREHGIPNALLTGRNRDRDGCAGCEASSLGLPQRGRGGESVVPVGEHLQVDAVLVVILGPGGAVAETPSLKLIVPWTHEARFRCVGPWVTSWVMTVIRIVMWNGA